MPCIFCGGSAPEPPGFFSNREEGRAGDVVIHRPPLSHWRGGVADLYSLT